ncbi:TonB-dependent receptor family protein [Pseudomonas fontis]|uniref:TonB-dependent receptor n=1 Tax=Pseudomonas fontis TaxID=2942633 RepID=A0ABT5NKN2_9PSED|nr:TonB-dependent receptor [Pseudomonas fontis]MDD0976154.1 TonB-dependent receptor [Pseudomonas fontis]MDD0989083.1 TonB-dependent receptor [Pseudomonas fontis]
MAAVGSALLSLAPQAWAAGEASEKRLETVTVQAAKATPAQAAQAELDGVPGGTSLVTQAEVEKGRSATLEDTLAFQPGVYAQAAGGNDAIKISIRGSGANTSPGYFREGTKFLFDGLALTGAGGTPYELLDTQGLNFTEVLRGANAFEYGALSLGGAINFVTQSGLTAPGSRVKLEGGSFGWQKQTLSSGGAEGNADYFVSIDNSRRDGYQDFTLAKAQGVVGNFGYRFSPKLETRLFVRYREEYHENSATLTREQIKHNPKQSNAATEGARADSTKRGSTWVGSKTTYTFDDDATLVAGLVYHNYPQILSRQSSINPNYWDWRDINYSLKYNRQDELFGLPSNTSIGWSSTEHIRSGVRTYRGDKDLGVLQKQVEYDGSFDHVFTLGNELGLTDNLYLNTGLSAIEIKRDINVTYSDRPNTSGLSNHYQYDEWKLAPRIGVRYYLTPDIQLFANASRSIDPPSSWSSSGSGITSNYAKPLLPQSANTVEFGIRGKAGIFDGSLALYKSWVKNELLTVQVLAATPTSAAVNSTSNATPTVHQGIEAGLSTRLWERDNGDVLTWRQTYTLNDFHYENDPLFNKNELPGLPKHVYQGELNYQYANGFYAGVNLRTVSSTAVDYANTFYAPSYTLWGARFGYDDPSRTWQVYLDLKNLTDQHYVTAVSPVYNANGLDTASLYPGDGFGAFTGITYNF